jgi:hypothetical protein
VKEIFDPGGGTCRNGPVDGGEGIWLIGIVTIDAGNFAAIPKSVIFHVFVRDEKRTILVRPQKEITVLRFQVSMGKVEIMASLDAFHDIANDIPHLSLTKGRLVLLISFFKICCQVVVAEFHEDAVSIVSGVELIPPVEHSDDKW